MAAWSLAVLVASAAPPLVAAPSGGYGLTINGPADGPATRGDGRLPRRMVVLVHGLDDSSAIWGDLVKALHRAGHDTACFDYPNDGPIGAAADLLGKCLEDLRSKGVRRVDIVAHSMGGLVAREVLGRRTFYDGDGAGAARLPAVDRVVMLGTPNHGAPLARLRQIGALRERLVGAITARSGWGSDPAADGNGEAASDLVPGSPFLERLNGRRVPTHTRFTIVAGRRSPWTDADVQHCLRVTRSARAPRWLRALGRRTAACMNGMIDGFGDGIVPIDSVRWDPVDDFVIIDADHAGMIRRSRSSAPTPPAVPIVLDRLRR